MKRLMEELPKLRAKKFPRAGFADVLTLTADSYIPYASLVDLDAYFRQFIRPPKEGAMLCVGCGATLVAETQLGQLFGLGSFVWGIAHGEGHCRDCGYPDRAYHRNVGPIKFLNTILQVHPDELEERAS